MGIKLVVTDIDGTLIDSSEKIPPQLAATVKMQGKRDPVCRIHWKDKGTGGADYKRAGHYRSLCHREWGMHCARESISCCP